jgi:hypothetical protein
MTALASWRDAAVILLSLEAFILALLVGAALYLAWRRLRQLQAWLVPYLLLVRTFTRRARKLTVRFMGALGAPFVRLRCLGEGLRRAFGILGGR